MITESLQKKIEQSIRLLQQVQKAHPDEVIESIQEWYVFIYEI